MCLLVFAYNSHPRYRFLLAGNRDEFHARPARAARWWPGADVLAGRDEQAGGTWLGTSGKGRFAVVTNFREMARADEQARSRGELVTQYLAGGDDFLSGLDRNHAVYSGYNLIAGELVTGPLHYCSNRSSYRQIDAGVHGISNHQLDTPWPKLSRSVSRLRGLLEHEVIPADDLFDLLADRTVAPAGELPDTGLSAELEQLLSAPFIVSPEYGTRCSTVVLLSRDNYLQFAERRYDSTGEVTGESRFGFQL